MVEDANHPLTHALARGAQALLAIAWWLLLAVLLWACFLRPPPRSLAHTVDWFSTPQPITTFAIAALLGGGCCLLWSMRRADPLALASIGFAVLTILLWGTSEALS